MNGDQSNPRRHAVILLDRVVLTGAYADILLTRLLEGNGLSKEDKALTSELVYGTLRWKGWLDWILKRTYRGVWEKVPSRVQRILEIGLYQILFLDRIPEYAAVHQAVGLTKTMAEKRWVGMVNYVLREILRNPALTEPPDIVADPVFHIATRWSCPQWIVKKWSDRFGTERTESICRANTERPKLNLRINLLKSSKRSVLKHLDSLDLPAVESTVLDEFITLERGGGLFQSLGFMNGWYSIQDVSAGLVAHLLDPKAGDCILDLTAAPGMKSTHMAELTANEAFIVANDRHAGRLSLVLENRERLGLNCIQPMISDGRFACIRSADTVLLDAPCSGLGVLRRRGDLRWKKTEYDLTELIPLQDALLDAASHVVKPGGTLVYSTCTLLAEENEHRVENFLTHHPEFSVEDASMFIPSAFVSEKGFLQTWPDLHGMDGTFAARLRKED